LYDVIVIGAGPAGNHAAYKLADLGHKVAVLDSRENIGDKLCTGIVGKECIQQFPVKDLKIFSEANAATFVGPSGTSLRLTKPVSQAYIIDRVAYIKSLAQKAKFSGAKYFIGHNVVHVDVDDENVTVKSSNGKSSHVFKASALVVASGFASNIPKRLGLGTIGDYVTGSQAEVMTSGLKETEVYFGHHFAPGFFAWLVPTDKGKALLGVLSREKAGYHLNSLLEKLKLDGKITSVIKPPKRWGIPLRPLNKTYGDRVVVVGDAAGQAKPTTGGGIYYALLSADKAAETISYGLLKNDLGRSILSQYEKKWKAILAKELRIGYYARRLYEMLNDNQLEELFKTIIVNGIHDKLIDDPNMSFDWHGNIIIKAMNFKIISKLIRASNPISTILK